MNQRISFRITKDCVVPNCQLNEIVKNIFFRSFYIYISNKLQRKLKLKFIGSLVLEMSISISIKQKTGLTNIKTLNYQVQ